MMVILLALAVLVVSVLATPNQCCILHVDFSPVRVAAPGNRDYVQLLSLDRVRTDAHTVEIVAEDGSVWYREREPGVTLSCCEYTRIYANEQSNGTFAVVLWLREQCRDRLALWSQDRIGGMFGIAVDGRLVCFDRLSSPLRDQFRIPGFSTFEAAQDAVRQILAKGYDVSI